jgi:hypothetical protein
MIDDVALAAGRGTLDLLAVPALEDGVDDPLAGGRRPVEEARRRDTPC